VQSFANAMPVLPLCFISQW